jgi:hypothetical protein
MRRIAALLVLATLAACGGSDSTSPSQNQTQSKTFTGTYVLQTVNGQALPYTFAFGNGDYNTIRAYNLTIGSAGSWISSTSTVSSTGGQVSDQPNGGQSGSYTYNGSTGAVSIISLDQSTVLSGSVSADLSTLTVTESSDIFVFKK